MGMTDPAPTLDEFETIARDTIARFPTAFRGPAGQVILRVSDWPDAEILLDLGIEDPCELTGLYEGIPLTQKSIFDMPVRPDTVWLFRQPILDEWRLRGDVTLADLVAHVTVHEFAHHFGWSDDDIAQIDRWWE
jgi:predicted Zn-dependent protease with MMP-like domain